MIDERCVLHRYKATSHAAVVGAALLGGFFLYDFLARDVLRWDLAIVLATMAVTKLGVLANGGRPVPDADPRRGDGRLGRGVAGALPDSPAATGLRDEPPAHAPPNPGTITAQSPDNTVGGTMRAVQSLPGGER